MSEESKEVSSGSGPRDSATLSECFDNAFELFNSINKSEEPTNGQKVQSDIKQAITMLEDATRLVSIVDMFSDNESFEEVATENIKYLLLPALLGTLVIKICTLQDRISIVNVAEIYFVDFLKRVKAYGLTNIVIPEVKDDDCTVDVPETNKSNAELITEMVTKRNTKLHRYKEQKELESRLETLRKNLSNLNIDDEIKRDYFVTLIKSFVNLALDELGSIAAEKPFLRYMQSMPKSDTTALDKRNKQRPTVTKLQPIIITRDRVQKEVYGAGYPSLPVMSVEEFYEQRVKEGDWPGPSERNKVNSKCLQDMVNTEEVDTTPEDAEDIEKEQKVEADDPELLQTMRDMDEYKDTHRRGWGNRANRS